MERSRCPNLSRERPGEPVTENVGRVQPLTPPPKTILAPVRLARSQDAEVCDAPRGRSGADT